MRRRWRAGASLAYKTGDRVRLVSRNGRDHTRRFADLAAAILKLSARTLVLDDEVAIYDQQLRSRFDRLREPDPDDVVSHRVRRSLVIDKRGGGCSMAFRVILERYSICRFA
jgi:ATP-dependent DNA ligase